ncbi:MAG: hypothetical protein E4H19_14375, partial [Chromatiales bacterium]
MAQFARPDGSVEVFNLLGGHSVNTTGNRYQNVDETSPVDTDYVYSQNSPGGGSNVEFGLSDVTDPAVSTGHILRFRHMQIDEDSGGHPQSANTGGTATTLAWELRQGSVPVIIASGSVNPAALTTTSVTLSDTEADSITDYTDLRVYLSPSGGAGSPANRRAVAVTWIELEVPNATPATNAPAEVATGSGLTLLASAALLVSVALASGSGAAHNASVNAQSSAEVASGVGAANDATVETAAAGITWGDWSLTFSNPIGALAELSVGTGVAADATADIGTNVETATGTGSAADASSALTANAENAAGTGSAADASAALTVSAENATGSGSAYDAAGGEGEIGPAENASGSGAAHDSTVAITTDVEVST